MRIGDLFGAIRRLWILSLLLAVLVGAAVFMVMRSTPPTYEYSASMLLLPPDIKRAELEGEQGYTRANPLFYLGSLTQTRDILIGAMSAKDVREAIEEKYPDTTYTTSDDALSSGPVLVLDVQSTDERQGSEALDSLAAAVPDELRKLQKGVGVKKDAMIQAHALTRDETPTVSQTARVRQGIMAGAALTVVGLFLIGLLDALRAQRRARAARAAAAAGDTAPAAAEPATDDEEPQAAPAAAAHASPPEDESAADEPADVEPAYAERAAEPGTAGRQAPDAGQGSADASAPELGPHPQDPVEDRDEATDDDTPRNGWRRHRPDAPRVPSSGGR